MDSREQIGAFRRQLAGQFHWLRFEPALEHDFRQHHFRRLSGFMRLGQYLGAGLYSVFALVLLAGAEAGEVVHASSAFRGVIVLSMLSMAWMIGRVPHHRLQPMMAGNYMVFAVCLAGIAVVSTSYDAAYRYEGILFAIFHCALFGCLLFRHNLFTCTAMFVIYVTLCASMGVPGRELIYQSFFIAMAIVLASCSRYQVEFGERDGFLRRRIMSISANFDELTGLSSRAAFDRFLRQHLRQNASGERRQKALVMFDLDHFKQLNDSRGHDTGDKCLQLVAEILKQAVEGGDRAAARWGGDELIAVLPADCEETLRQRLEAIRQEVANLRMDNPGSPLKQMSISIGAAIISPEQRLNESVIFRRADEALYDAKEGGRNRVVIQTAVADPAPASATA